MLSRMFSNLFPVSYLHIQFHCQSGWENTCRLRQARDNNLLKRDMLGTQEGKLLHLILKVRVFSVISKAYSDNV